MTTQVRPSGGGAWNTVTPTVKSCPKNQVLGLTLPVQRTSNALGAINQWINCGGTGTAATLAQKRAAAVGLQLQEV